MHGKTEMTGGRLHEGDEYAHADLDSLLVFQWGVSQF